jgi:Patatin-like phospholipase
VLQGGGALGAYQAGVYEAMAEAGIHPDWVAGVSVGATNGAIIAGNPPSSRISRLREFWTQATGIDGSPLLRSGPLPCRMRMPLQKEPPIERMSRILRVCHNARPRCAALDPVTRGRERDVLNAAMHTRRPLWVQAVENHVEQVK